ncbi:MAG: UDP-N-acetylglucosamine 2-epimerase (non-hydrolyzing) [Deltaproteobacteria bacterium]|jgi:UDP-N-acetylglucosamine 2-epimerase (non-hydrolysing)|nr:UDP-N-acetylglucosamine 2-epimerase (non-hydrolyzing) [Deltaproteobacteria bacterium]
MKIAPLYKALRETDWAEPVIVHTGQHYDINMSDAFFRDLGLPGPDIHLGVGSGTHAGQTGMVMIKYEEVLTATKPDLVVVVGDVNSTMAATLAAVKLGIKVAHLEAGLRSFDRTMPEEINRLVTDTIADILWTPSVDGDDNLLREGVNPSKIVRVGNIMIDSLEMLRARIEQHDVYNRYGLGKGKYGVATFHRPANVDNESMLRLLCEVLDNVTKSLPIILPVHPRTKSRLEQYDLLERMRSLKGLILVEPLGYVDFMNLIFNCRLVITDSGGIQEETTYLGIPCRTVRDNTERPITVTRGTNKLCRLEQLPEEVDRILSEPPPGKAAIDLWDGRVADRVVDSIREICT